MFKIFNEIHEAEGKQRGEADDQKSGAKSIASIEAIVRGKRRYITSNAFNEITHGITAQMILMIPLTNLEKGKNVFLR